MKKIWMMALACVICLGLAAPASAADVRGVTDSEILIGQWGPQTGPAALWGAVARGTGLLFQVVNDEGGINGRKIKYYLRDDAYQPNKTKAIVKDLVENVGVFAFACGVGTSPGLAVMDYLVEKDIPWVGPATGSNHWVDPIKKNVFATYPSYVLEAKILTRYILDTMKKQKVGIVYQNDDYGKAGLEGVEAVLKERKLAACATVPTEITDTDLASHVLKLKEAGCEAVILWLLPKQAVITVGTAAKLGFKPNWVACSTLSDDPLMLKISKGLWKGVVHGNFIEPPDSKNPLMIKYKKAQEKYAPKERWGVFYYAGIGFVEPMIEGLKRAGKDLNPDSFAKAMESIKDFKGIMGNISFGPKQHQGSTQIFLAKCGPKGEVIKLTDWISGE